MNKKWLIGLAAATLLFGAGASLALTNTATVSEVNAVRPIYTKSVSVATEATRLSWKNGNAYRNWTDASGIFNFVADAGNTNNGKYYSSNNSYRCYSGGKLTITIAEGYQFVSITTAPSFTFNIDSGKTTAVASFAGTTQFTSFAFEYINLSDPEQTEFHVTYDGNGAPTGSTIDDTIYEENETVTVKPNGFSWEFREFVEWNTKADGTGTAYVPAETFEIAKDVTLYAQWGFADTVVADGSYTASLSYHNPIGSSVNVANGEDVTVGLVEITSTNVTYDGTAEQYLLASTTSGTGKVTFTNHTNAKFTKIVLETYPYDNVTVKADGVAKHTGDNTMYADHNLIEVDFDAENTISVEANNKYAAKIYSMTLYMKVGDGVIHATSVDLNAEAGDVYVGKTRQLTATVLPMNADDRSVTWTSSDESVATVNASGLVTGVAEGTAIITATTTDGGFEASFAATVKPVSYGTLLAPLTPEEAFEVLQIADTSVSAEPLFVRGIVGESTYNKDNKNWEIWFKSSDGTINRYFELYRTVLDDSFVADYTRVNALVNLDVVATGYGKMFSGTPELSYEKDTATVVKSITYSAHNFADHIMIDTVDFCNAYVDESDYAARKATLVNLWDALEEKYGTLSAADVEEIVSAKADEEGSLIEQAMARYDYLTGKYELNNFITGRTPVAFAHVPFASNAKGQTPMIATLITLLSVSVLATGAFIFARKKKEN